MGYWRIRCEVRRAYGSSTLPHPCLQSVDTPYRSRGEPLPDLGYSGSISRKFPLVALSEEDRQ